MDLIRFMRCFCTLGCVLLLVLLAPPASAQIEPAGIFASGAVLQRDRPIAIWGTAMSAGLLRAEIRDDGQVISSGAGNVNADGTWRVTLPALAAGGPYVLSLRTDTEELLVEDVLVGEIWLASGQSNMNMLVRPNGPWSAGVLDYEQVITSSSNSRVRLFDVETGYSTTPGSQVLGVWRSARPQTTGEFSGVAYFFAKRLHEALGVPVGVITAAVGGTSAAAWTPREALLADPDLAEIVAAYESRLVRFPAELASWPQRLAQWEAESGRARAAGLPEPARPPSPKDPTTSIGSPFILYNAMIHPLAGSSIRGVIWYQGEGDVREPVRHTKLLPAMVSAWRGAWKQDFPFIYVQLANYRQRPAQPGASNVAELREAQAVVQDLIPNSAMITAVDVGEADTIHPRNKQEVGRRLSLAARALAYGQQVSWRGPRVVSVEFVAGAAHVVVDADGGELEVRGPEADRSVIRGFALAGEDRVWHWADARIDANGRITVSSARVARPVAMRYGWAANPECNVYDKSGLPLLPFRSDAWNEPHEFVE